MKPFVWIATICLVISAGCTSAHRGVQDVDLGIGSKDIFTHIGDNGGRYVGVRIHNRSDIPVTVGTSFFAGDPDKGGEQIGDGLLEIQPRSTGGSATPWAAGLGNHEIVVLIETSAGYRDVNRNDNTATAVLTVE